MRRFLVGQVTGIENTLTICGSEAVHITRVLKMAAGDRCVVMGRTGGRALCEIKATEGGSVLLNVLEHLPAPPKPPVEIVLCQALLKNRAMDLVVEKASELGVSGIRPFISERTVVRPDGKSAANKIRRWNEIAGSAAKQCDREMPAAIEPIRTFDEVLERCRDHGDKLNLILWEQETGISIGSIIDGSKPVKSVVCIVGPEGGFTGEEILSARSNGILSVGLGPRVMRAETAAITITAILQYVFGGMERP